VDDIAAAANVSPRTFRNYFSSKAEAIALKATAAGQDDLAKAIAERTATSVAHDMYPQLAAAVVGAGIGVALGHWLRGGPVGSIVPLLGEVFDLIRGGLPGPAETPRRTHR
jgi:AcrR family transcriptional regulator